MSRENIDAHANRATTTDDAYEPSTRAVGGSESTGRRAAVAGFVGTAIEYYDFSIYGFLTVYFAAQFFPNENPAVEIITALLVFGSAYVARPMGGIVLGWYGDRVGRRPVLLVSVIGVGICAGLIGTMPSYDRIGLAAPILVVVIRLIQGFCAGGEVMGALTYVAESSPTRKKGLFGSLTVMGSSVGFGSAALSVGLVSALLDDGAMASWGWRIPFLVCVPLSIGAFAVRRRLAESAAVTQASRRRPPVRAPVVGVVRGHTRALVGGIGLAVAITGAGYVGLSYLPVYLVTTLGYDRGATSWVVAAAISSALVVYPVAGTLVDTIGRRRLFFGATCLYVTLAFPMFLAISAANNLVLVWLVFTVFMMLSGVQSVGAMTLLPEIFPAEVRVTGSALSHNLGIVLGGAFAGYICAQLVSITGNAISPAYYVIGVAVVGLGGLAVIRTS